MTRLLILPLAAALLICSCGSNDVKVKNSTKNEDGTTTTTEQSVDMDALKKLSEGSNDMTKKVEELKKVKPLTIDELKALLPAEINGIKRTDYQANSTMGYSIVNGEYKKDGETELKVIIYDCAGEAGAGFYGLTYMSMMNFQQESEKEYTKTIDFKGGRAIEKYNKESKESNLTYVSNDRLLIVLEGRNMDPSELKSAADNLKISL